MHRHCGPVGGVVGESTVAVDSLKYKPRSQQYTAIVDQLVVLLERVQYSTSKVGQDRYFENGTSCWSLQMGYDVCAVTAKHMRFENRSPTVSWEK